MSAQERAYSYMMDALKKIIRKVEEISVDWWWFELGKIPVIQVRRLDTGGSMSFDYTPKLPVVDALKVIQRNFELIKTLPRDKRVDYALKSAHDLYLVLLAVTYIMEAHDLAEKLNEYKEKISNIAPESVDIILDEIRSFVSELRETLARNVFSWPDVRERFEEEVNRFLERLKKISKIKETRAEEEAVGGEVPA